MHIVVLFLAVLAGQSAAISISWTSPNYGSVHGGQLIFIYGSGFSSDQYSLPNNVWIGNGAVSSACKVESYYSTPNKIACITGPSPTGDSTGLQPLTVVINALAITCNVSQCMYGWSWYRTPELSSISPVAGPPNTVLTLVAPDYTQDVPTVTRTMIGPVACRTNDFAGTDATNFDGEAYNCIAQNAEAGSYLVSLNIPTLGTADKPWQTGFVSTANVPYNFQTFPWVWAYSPSTVSTAGGSVITINGAGFSYTPGKVTVTVGGVACEVISSTVHEIRCLTGAEPTLLSVGVYLGSRGAYRDIAAEFSGGLDELATASYNSTTVIDRFGTPIYSNEGDGLTYNYGQRLRSFFVAPTTNTYTFYLNSDDSSVLFFSPVTGRAADATQIAFNPQWGVPGQYQFPSQISESFSLSAGQAYYIEARHQQGVGGEFLQVGLRIDNTTHAAAEVDGSVAEVQTVYLSVPVVPEVQQITVPAGVTGDFVINWGSRSTVPISATAPASAVREALNSIFGTQCESDPITTPLPSVDAFLYDDFENSSYIGWSGLPSGSTFARNTSFCGRQAALLPYAWGRRFDNSDSTRRGFKLSQYPYICMAYNFERNARVNLQVSINGAGTFSIPVAGEDYLDSLGDYTYPKLASWNTTESYVYADERWHHSCFDLRAAATARFGDSSNLPNQTDFVVSALGFASPFSSQIGISGRVYLDEFVVAAFDRAVSQVAAPAFSSRGVAIKDFSVSLNSRRYTIGLAPYNCAVNFPLLTFNTTFLTGGVPTVSRLSAASGPLNGTFTLTFGDSTTLPLDVKTTQGLELQLALQANTNGYHPITPGVKVNYVGTCSSKSWAVSFIRNAGRQPLMTIDASDLGAGTSVVLNRTVPGGLFYETIPGDFLRTYYDTPQLQVTVNGVPGQCAPGGSTDGLLDCSVAFDNSALPVVSQVAPTSGGTGTVLTITGTNFGTQPGQNVVRFEGGAECAVINGTISSTQLQCTVGRQPAGTYRVSQRVLAFGYAISTSDFTHVLSVDAVTPSTVSLFGGIPVTVSGDGFTSDASVITVTVGGTAATVVAADLTSVKFVAPSLGSASAASVAITALSSSVTAVLTYSAAVTPAIDAVSPSSGSGGGNYNVTISGSGLGSLATRVSVGGVSARVLSATATEIVYVAPGHVAGTADVQVTVDGVGASNTHDFLYVLAITSVSPTVGSAAGGTPVTITGSGFVSSVGQNVSVTLGNFVCDVTSITDTEIQCLTRAASTRWTVTNWGTNPNYGLGYLWDPAALTITEGDTILWLWTGTSYTQTLHSVARSATPTSLAYDGIGFRSVASSTGNFTFGFNAIGNFTYIDPAFANIGMRASIEVRPYVTLDATVYVRVNGVNATGTASFTFATASTPKLQSVSIPLEDTAALLQAIVTDRTHKRSSSNWPVSASPAAPFDAFPPSWRLDGVQRLWMTTGTTGSTGTSGSTSTGSTSSGSTGSTSSGSTGSTSTGTTEASTGSTSTGTSSTGSTSSSSTSTGSTSSGTTGSTAEGTTSTGSTSTGTSSSSSSSSTSTGSTSSGTTGSTAEGTTSTGSTSSGSTGSTSTGESLPEKRSAPETAAERTEAYLASRGFGGHAKRSAPVPPPAPPVIIRGAAFGASASELNVTLLAYAYDEVVDKSGWYQTLAKPFAGATVSIASFSSDQITLSLSSDLPAGAYQIAVARSGVGKSFAAPGNDEFYVFPTVQALSAQRGSVAGGLTLTIYGSGFQPSDSSAKNRVVIGNTPCVVRSSTLNEIVCETGQALDDGYSAVVAASKPSVYLRLQECQASACLRTASLVNQGSSPSRGAYRLGTGAGALAVVPGRTGNDVDTAVSFAGGAYAAIPAFGAVDDGSFTAEFWVKPTSAGLAAGAGTWRLLLSNADLTNTGGFFVWLAPNGRLEFWLGTGQKLPLRLGSFFVPFVPSELRALYAVATGGALGSTEFSHVIVQWDAASRSQTVIVDGALHVNQTVPSNTTVRANRDSSQPIYVAGWPLTTTNLGVFAGAFDEIALYREALSVDIVQDHVFFGASAWQPISVFSGPFPATTTVNPLAFEYLPSLTPRAFGIDRAIGFFGDAVVVSGAGFDPVASNNRVFLGSVEATVIAATATNVTFTVPRCTAGSYDVRVVVADKGAAAWICEAEDDSCQPWQLGESAYLLTYNRPVVFQRQVRVESFSPAVGSLGGGTLVTITGDGFSAAAWENYVLVAGTGCVITAQSLTSLSCVTQSAAAGSGAVSVMVRTGVQPGLSARYWYTQTLSRLPNFAALGAPDVTRVESTIEHPNSLNAWPGLISPVNFAARWVGLIRLERPGAWIIQIASDDGVQLFINGVRLVSMNQGQGVTAAQATLNVVQPGYQELQIDYFQGLSFSALVLSYQGPHMSELTVVPASALFRSPSSGSTYLGSSESTTFSYVASHTPTITALSRSGDQLSVSLTLPHAGSTFGSVSTTTVSVGSAPCAVGNVNGKVDCTLPTLAAGRYDVSVKVPPYGLSVVASSSIEFVEPLVFSTFAPTSGSFGAGQLLTVTGSGFAAAAVAAANLSTYTGLPVLTVCGVRCKILSLEPTQLTCRVQPLPSVATNFSYYVGNPASRVCDVAMTVNGISAAAASGSFTFEKAATAIVNSVSPHRGGTAGGVLVTIEGVDFDPAATVTIGGADCRIVQQSATVITCLTSPKTTTFVAPVIVQSGTGYALNNPEGTSFEYIDLWSSRFTWGGEDPPREGETVYIAPGQTVLLDCDTPVLNLVLIQGGALIFDDSRDIRFSAHYVLVDGGGLFQVGTEEKPFQHTAIITLHGTQQSLEMPVFGAKVLAVRQGTLDLHGIPKGKTWSQLAAPARVGDTYIDLLDTVSWHVGDVIVIAPTSQFPGAGINLANTFAPSCHTGNACMGVAHNGIGGPGMVDGITEDETASIVSIEPNEFGGSRIHLDLARGLEFYHEAMEYELAGRTVHMRAEVGLLSHNVIVQGNVNEQFQDNEALNGDMFGGTVMMAQMAGPNTLTSRIENAEFRYVGQAYHLARYPIHWHMSKWLTGCYVKRCSIHNTFNRALTMHGSHNGWVENNVAYHVMGHTFFLEDGIEHDNKMIDNLGIYTMMSNSLLNTDQNPAVFWMTNPNNYWIGNHAAGGSHSAFWLRLDEHPSGMSQTYGTCPGGIPLGQWTNNVAHGMGQYGFWIRGPTGGYFPTDDIDGCNGNTQIARFTNFTAWRNDKGFEALTIGAVQFHNFALVENIERGAEIAAVTVGWGQCVVDDILIDAKSPAYNNPGGRYTLIGFRTPGSPFLSLSNVYFANFDTPSIDGLPASSTLVGCSWCYPHQGGFETRFSNVTFINSPNVAYWTNQFNAVYFDEDGTLTGIVGGTMLPWSPILDPVNCVVSANLSMSAFSGCYCNANVSIRRVLTHDMNPTSLENWDMNITNSWGSVSNVFKNQIPAHGWLFLVPARTHLWVQWNVDMQARVDFNNFTIDISDLSGGYSPLGDYSWFHTPFLQVPDHFKFNGISREMTSLPQPSDPSLSYVFQLVDGPGPQLIWSFRGDGIDNLRIDKLICPDDGCPLITPPLPSNQSHVRWSNVTSWPNGRLPVAGENVTIPQWMYMILDVSTPELQLLEVYGRLIFEDAQDLNLTAHYIVVSGGEVIIGTADEPFTHRATVTLLGDRETPHLRFPNLNVDAGAKNILVFGNFSAFGVPQTVQWTYLAETARQGSTQIKLRDAPSWHVGDEIILPSTSYNPHHVDRAILVASDASWSTWTLDRPLVYDHVVQTAGGLVTFAGEVGLLTHNVVIQGDPDKSLEQAFGVRILVGSWWELIENYRYLYVGQLQLDSVEVRYAAQRGWSDPDDPRYTVVFTGLPPTTASYIRRSSLHDNFCTALGVFDVQGFEFSDNVVYESTGPTVMSNADFLTLNRNLFARARAYRYDNAEFDEFVWSMITVTGRYNQVRGNVAAGSDRMGYQMWWADTCHPTEAEPIGFADNVAHSMLHGVFMRYEVNMMPRGCITLNGFSVFRNWDFGFCVHVQANVSIVNARLLDNRVGFMVNVIARNDRPPFVNYTDVVIAGDGDEPNCDRTRPPGIVKNSFMSAGARAGVYLSSFTKALPPMCPPHLFQFMKTFPSIQGRVNWQNATFVNFRESDSCGLAFGDQAITSNPESPDATHPNFFRNVAWVSNDYDARFLLHEPNPEWINPEQCVDMDCDGLKHVLLKDVDGTLLNGTAGGSLTSISEVRFDWSKIPAAQVTTPQGDRIPNEVIAPHQGVSKGTDCVRNSQWHSWQCPASDNHMMFIMESKDPDTLERRLSPVGLRSETGYLDLLNGPASIGWCQRYSCLQRPGNVYSIIKASQSYTMYLAGTAATQTRFWLLNAEPTDGFTFGMFYSTAQRIDVYKNGVFIEPNNAQFIYDAVAGNQYVYKGQNDSYIPSLDSFSGANYYSRDKQTLYIVMKGDVAYIDAIVAPVVQVSFTLAVPIGQFFGPNLLANMAFVLQIPPNTIRLVKAVPANGVTKRSVAGSAITIEISEPPVQQLEPEPEDDEGTVSNPVGPGMSNNGTSGNMTDSNATRPDRVFDAQDLAAMNQINWLSGVMNSFVAMIQNGSLANSMPDIVASSIQVTPPTLPYSDDFSEPRPAFTPRIPTAMHLSPAYVNETFYELAQLPEFQINITDDTGALFTDAAVTWYIAASLRDRTGSLADSAGNTYLGGATAVALVNGTALFANLTLNGFSTSDVYTLTFTASQGNFSKTIMLAVNHRTSGSTGTSGTSGSVGSTGTSGSVGSTGSSGSVGSTGTSGSVGSTGTTGTVGTSGSTGSTGTTRAYVGPQPPLSELEFVVGDTFVTLVFRLLESVGKRVIVPPLDPNDPTQVAFIDLQMSLDGTLFTTIFSQNTTASFNYTHTGLQPGTTYQFRLQFRNADGVATVGAAQSVTTVVASASTSSSGSVKVQSSANAEDAGFFANTGAVAGVIGGAAALAVILIIVAIVLIRRRNALKRVSVSPASEESLRNGELSPSNLRRNGKTLNSGGSSGSVSTGSGSTPPDSPTHKTVDAVRGLLTRTATAKADRSRPTLAAGTNQGLVELDSPTSSPTHVKGGILREGSFVMETFAAKVKGSYLPDVKHGAGSPTLSDKQKLASPAPGSGPTMKVSPSIEGGPTGTRLKPMLASNSMLKLNFDPENDEVFKEAVRANRRLPIALRDKGTAATTVQRAWRKHLALRSSAWFTAASAIQRAWRARSSLRKAQDTHSRSVVQRIKADKTRKMHKSAAELAVDRQRVEAALAKSPIPGPRRSQSHSLMPVDPVGDSLPDIAQVRNVAKLLRNSNAHAKGRRHGHHAAVHPDASDPAVVAVSDAGSVDESHDSLVSVHDSRQF